MTIPLSFVAGMGTLDDATPGAQSPDGAGHRPVLLTPLIESLQPRPGQIAVDATFVFALGISSVQLDDPARGFSFRLDGPLDMRMNPSSGVTAANLVDSLTADELTSMIRDYGDERFARSIANRIVRARERTPITTTTQLRELVEQVVPRRF